MARPYTSTNSINLDSVNRLFGLELTCDFDSFEPDEESEEFTWAIASEFLKESAVFDVLWTVDGKVEVLGSYGGGSASMMSHDPIGLYELTLDDDVYFFQLAEPWSRRWNERPASPLLLPARNRSRPHRTAAHHRRRRCVTPTTRPASKQADRAKPRAHESLPLSRGGSLRAAQQSLRSAYRPRSDPRPCGGTRPGISSAR